jgi:hypothetical protein
VRCLSTEAATQKTSTAGDDAVGWSTIRREAYNIIRASDQPLHNKDLFAKLTAKCTKVDGCRERFCLPCGRSAVVGGWETGV